MTMPTDSCAFRIGLALLLSVMAAAPTQAQTRSGITITDAWARRAPGGHGSEQAANGAVYMIITNTGPADAVTSATSDVARVVELHETRSEGGVMVMRPLERFPLPAGGKLELRPGSYHVMLMGLTRHLHAGDTVKVTLSFDKAPPVTVEAAVR